MHQLKNEKKRKAFGKHFGVPPELRYPLYVQQKDYQHLLNLQKSVTPRVQLYINFPLHVRYTFALPPAQFRHQGRRKFWME